MHYFSRLPRLRTTAASGAADAVQRILDRPHATRFNSRPTMKPMSTRVLWALLIPCTLVATACPTRIVTTVDAGRDTAPAAGGTGGSGGRGVGAAAGAAGKSDIGGQAGASLSGTGGEAGPPAGRRSASESAAGGAARRSRRRNAGAPGAGGAAGRQARSVPAGRPALPPEGEPAARHRKRRTASGARCRQSARRGRAPRSTSTWTETTTERVRPPGSAERTTPVGYARAERRLLRHSHQSSCGQADYPGEICRYTQLVHLVVDNLQWRRPHASMFRPPTWWPRHESARGLRSGRRWRPRRASQQLQTRNDLQQEPAVRPVLCL